jgi:ferredoxin-thioredoxin reductase catalytic chain
MTVAELYRQLKKINEPKGYQFNRDAATTTFLLEALLTNRQRYGYMCCPCRLAAEDREADRDIICPCVYREADVREFGSCYCNLYVTAAWNEGLLPHLPVPERRPADTG